MATKNPSADHTFMVEECLTAEHVRRCRAEDREDARRATPHDFHNVNPRSTED